MRNVCLMVWWGETVWGKYYHVSVVSGRILHPQQRQVSMFAIIIASSGHAQCLTEQPEAAHVQQGLKVSSSIQIQLKLVRELKIRTVEHQQNTFMLVFEIVHYELNKFICDNFFKIIIFLLS